LSCAWITDDAFSSVTTSSRSLLALMEEMGCTVIKMYSQEEEKISRINEFDVIVASGILSLNWRIFSIIRHTKVGLVCCNPNWWYDLKFTSECPGFYTLQETSARISDDSTALLSQYPYQKEIELEIHTKDCKQFHTSSLSENTIPILRHIESDSICGFSNKESDKMNEGRRIGLGIDNFQYLTQFGKDLVCGSILWCTKTMWNTETHHFFPYSVKKRVLTVIILCGQDNKGVSRSLFWKLPKPILWQILRLITQ